MTRETRPISWIRAALRDFEKFPEEARAICLAALTIAAEGGMADIAKPLRGLGSGVFEIALAFRGDAFRVVRGATCTRSVGRTFVPEKVDSRRQDASARD
jgi:phage-related protein